MKRYLYIPVLLLAICFISCVPGEKQSNQDLDALELTNLPSLGEVNERYQSVNVEMCEVVGGDFWIPYAMIDTAKLRTEGFSALKRGIPPIDLNEEKIRNLASALGPMYIRVSGTWANTTYFQDNDAPKLTSAPEGFENVLTRREWKGVIDFCQAIDAKLVTSFAISDGIRDKEGNWTPAQIQPLLNYTKSIGGDIAAAEMFNEPSHASYGGAPEGYDASYYARDFERFKQFVDSLAPEMKIMGPGSTGEGGIIPVGESMTTDKILNAEPMPEFDIFSYHFYGGISRRCRGELSPENALTKEWLSRTELGLQFYEHARNKYLPEAPIWLTETGEAACGGNPWASTYIDCFRYVEQLGCLAKHGVKVVMHNTLCASEYALLEQETHDPRPNYWAALLWSKLMGQEVFEARFTHDQVDAFVHNLKHSEKGRAVLLVNPADVASEIKIPSSATQFILTADDLLGKTVKLNGKVLQLQSDNTLPEITGEVIPAGNLQLPAHSITFLSFEPA
ncbi:MAG: hypothetical protein KDC80_29105 [Saprospiraceae bacterium]|nr:hypothetical protein [Saprospiraceae bacterium]